MIIANITPHFEEEKRKKWKFMNSNIDDIDKMKMWTDSMICSLQFIKYQAVENQKNWDYFMNC